MAALATAVNVFLVLTKVTLAGSSAVTQRVTENDCAVHSLPLEVLQQLINSADLIRENFRSDTVPHSESGVSDIAVNGSDYHNLQRKLDRLESEQTELKKKVQSLEAEISGMRERKETCSTAHDNQSNMVIQELIRQVKDQLSEQVLQLQEDSREMRDQLSEQVLQLQEDSREMKDQLSEQMVQLQQETKGIKEQQSNVSHQISQALQVPGAVAEIGYERRDHLNSRRERPRDCYDLLRSGINESGVYTIYPQGCGIPVKAVDVWCDMGEESEEGGWTVVLLRRPLDTQVDFNRGWRDYRIGFGSPETEYWIGNEVLHLLTSKASQVLRVDMTDWDEESRYVEYSYFYVGDRDHQYSLRLGTMSGTAGDSLKDHDNMLFSTPDRDNDIDARRNCADIYKSGFWFTKCHSVSPTNPLLRKEKNVNGMTWESFRKDRTTLRTITFKMKPALCLAG